jgi:hypothetical protein
MPEDEKHNKGAKPVRDRLCMKMIDGQRCALKALANSQYCEQHDPSRSGGGGGRLLSHKVYKQ